MKSAVIVLNRNKPDMTDRLCDHIERTCRAEFDLFVIEAGSDEDKLSKHKTHWINNPETMENGLRPAKGFNRGIEIARHEGDYDSFWCVINDMNLTNQDALSALHADLEKYPEIGVIQPALLYSQWGDKKVPGDKFGAKPGRVRLVPYFTHFALMVRREVLDEIGPLYDEDNWLAHGGDIEICWRAWQAGFAVAISGNCGLWEYVGGSLGGSENPAHEEFMRQAQADMLKWMQAKYGFKSKDEMRRQNAKAMARFLRINPELRRQCDVDYLGLDPSLVKPVMRRLSNVLGIDGTWR